MPRTPNSDAEFVSWAQLRVATWAGGQSGPPNIGLSAQQIADAQVLVDDAVARLAAQDAARAKAKQATAEKDTSVASLRSNIGGLIGIIDGYARATDDPDVYARAQIDAPKPPAPRSDAPIPTDVQVDLRNDGTVEFSFKVTSGGSAVYPVQRQVTDIAGVQGPFEDVGQADENKKFFDSSVPSGVRSIDYRVRTRLTNGELSDWSETATVRFGTGSGTASSTTSAASGDSKAA